jgi:hypothetical protein
LRSDARSAPGIPASGRAENGDPPEAAGAAVGAPPELQAATIAAMTATIAIRVVGWNAVRGRMFMTLLADAHPRGPAV